MNACFILALILSTFLHSSSAQVAASNCICPMIYAPVCGVDGKTYSNKCVAACAEVQVAYAGECNNTCNSEDCTYTTAPQVSCPHPASWAVSGPSGLCEYDTYSGACAEPWISCPDDPYETCSLCGGFAGIQCPSGFQCVDDPRDECNPNDGGRDCGGVCINSQSEDCPNPSSVSTTIDACDCPSYYEPVCGSDGSTYGNKCLMLCAGVDFVRFGDCNNTCHHNDCIYSKAPIRQCPHPASWATEGPTGLCVFNPKNSKCFEPWSHCPADPYQTCQMCGGFAAIPCASNENCVDDPRDNCDPNNGGRDCSGVCINQNTLDCPDTVSTSSSIE